MAIWTIDNATHASGSAARRTTALVPQLSRYAVASCVALAADFSIFLALCSFAVNPPVAGIVGYAAGMLIHYALSSMFVFDVAHARKAAPRRLAEFIASGLLGLALTVGIISALTGYFDASPVIAKATAASVSFFTIFLARRWIVFAPPPGGETNLGVVYSKSGSYD